MSTVQILQESLKFLSDSKAFAGDLQQSNPIWKEKGALHRSRGPILRPGIFQALQ